MMNFNDDQDKNGNNDVIAAIFCLLELTARAMLTRPFAAEYVKDMCVQRNKTKGSPPPDKIKKCYILSKVKVLIHFQFSYSPSIQYSNFHVNSLA